MADKHRGRMLIGRLEGASAGGVLELAGATDVFSGANIVKRLNIGRVRDAGDAAATMVANATATSDIDGTNLFYEAPITADRAVTLTVAGAYAGMKWRVTREVAASGAFNVNVGSGPLKALAAGGSWCDVTFDGTAWVLTAAGTL